MLPFIHNLIDLPKLTIDNTPNGRYYCTPDGNRYPSITTILSKNPEKIASLQEWRARIGEAEANRISVTSASRGTALHNLMENYVMKGVTCDVFKTPILKKMFFQCRDVINDNLEEVYSAEASLYSDFLKVTGTPDMICRWAGRNTVVDYKTSLKPKSEEYILDYFLQTTAYAIMFEERTGIRIPGLVIIISNVNDDIQVFWKNCRDYVKPLIKILENNRRYL